MARRVSISVPHLRRTRRVAIRLALPALVLVFLAVVPARAEPSSGPTPTRALPPDAFLVLQHLRGTRTLLPEELPRVDANSDGVIDVADIGVMLSRETVFELPGGVPLVMVRIPQGSFLMGSPQSEVDAGWAYTGELPQHAVTIEHDYWMGKYEVTQRQWLAVLGSNPSYYSPADPRGKIDVTLDNPVETVSWTNVQAFEAALNGLGLGGTFRLPSEAEWEYAARGGTQTRFHFGDSDCSPSSRCTECSLSQYAWWCTSNLSNAVHHPGGLKLPNLYGLYDTAGNVSECVEDDWHSSYTGAPTNGSSWVENPRGGYRVFRGGAWYDYAAQYCRPAIRGYITPGYSLSYLGFRLAWTP